MTDDPHPACCASCGRPAGSWATDRLTGLLDRWGWDDLAPAALARAAGRGHPISLLAIDIDRFKRINDKYGHVAGDEVLRSVATTLRGLTRSGDLLGRYGGHGGDEFLVLLPRTDAGSATGIAERIRAGVRAMAVPATATNGRAVTIERLTASVGVCVRRPGVEDLLAMIMAADAALQAAKEGGRNRVHVAGTDRATEFRIRPIHIGLPAAALAIACVVGGAQPAANQPATAEIHQALTPVGAPLVPAPTAAPAPPPVVVVRSTAPAPTPKQHVRSTPPKRKKTTAPAAPLPPPPATVTVTATPRMISLCEMMRSFVTICQRTPDSTVTTAIHPEVLRRAPR